MLSFLCRALGQDLVDGAGPLPEEIVRVENVVASEWRWTGCRTLALHHGEAVLAADAARELHDERIRLRGDAADRAALKPRAAARALHLPDGLEDRADPVHAAHSCTTLATR